MKAIQVLHGHSSFKLTADTYTSVLPRMELEAADAPVSLVPRKTTRQGAQTEAGGPQAVTAAGSAEAPASSFTSTSGAHVAVRPMPRPAPDASPASAAEDQSAA